MTIADGEIIGRTYRVERLLGEGGMARVYLVTHTRMPKRFALKLIAISGGSGKAKGDFIARFRQEATVLARLHHPHIVDVVDYDETPDGMPFLVMEYLEGEDLAHFLSRTNVLQQDVALAIAYQVGTALQAAHDAGVVHRDISIIYSVSLRKPQKTIQRRRRDDVDASSEWKSHILDAASH